MAKQARSPIIFVILGGGLTAMPPVGVRMGTHILLEVHDAPFDVLNSSARVLSSLYAAVHAGGLTVVGELAHEFPVQGCSAILMISESHLSIHTWPENGYAAVCSGALRPSVSTTSLR